jgi:hypothetical protein
MVVRIPLNAHVLAELKVNSRIVGNPEITLAVDRLWGALELGGKRLKPEVFRCYTRKSVWK